MSIVIRTRARIEHNATPMTTTTTEIGLRSAARRSHMVMALLVYCHGVIAEKAQGRLAPRQLKRDSAKPQVAPERHRFQLALKGSVRQKHPQASQVQLDSVRVPGFPLYGPLRVQGVCSLRFSGRHRVRLALCVVVLLGLATPGRTALAPHVHSQPLPPSST